MKLTSLDLVRRFDCNGLTREDTAIRLDLYWFVDRMLDYEQQDWCAAGEWMNKRLEGKKPADRLIPGECAQ